MPVPFQENRLNHRSSGIHVVVWSWSQYCGGQSRLRRRAACLLLARTLNGPAWTVHPIEWSCWHALGRSTEQWGEVQLCGGAHWREVHWGEAQEHSREKHIGEEYSGKKYIGEKCNGEEHCTELHRGGAQKYIGEKYNFVEEHSGECRMERSDQQPLPIQEPNWPNWLSRELILPGKIYQGLLLTKSMLCCIFQHMICSPGWSLLSSMTSIKVQENHIASKLGIFENTFFPIYFFKLKPQYRCFVSSNRALYVTTFPTRPFSHSTQSHMCKVSQQLLKSKPLQQDYWCDSGERTQARQGKGNVTMIIWRP